MSHEDILLSIIMIERAIPQFLKLIGFMKDVT